MNIPSNNDKIQKYLDELADEYKTLLYKALVSRSEPLDDLSISELLRLDNEIKKPLFNDYQRQQKRRRIFLTMGLTYIFAGFFCFFIFKALNGNFFGDINGMVTLFSVTLGIMGAFLCVYSFASQAIDILPKKHIEKQEENPVLLEYEVVMKWRELEGLVNDISIAENVKMPRSIIDFMVNDRLIDENECSTLKHFLKIRNDVVHFNNSRYSANEIKEVVDKVDKIIDRIRKIV